MTKPKSQSHSATATDEEVLRCWKSIVSGWEALYKTAGMLPSIGGALSLLDSHMRTLVRIQSELVARRALTSRVSVSENIAISEVLIAIFDGLERLQRADDIPF